MHSFQKRIHYQGDLHPLLQQVCKDFDIGQYTSHGVIPIGHEDFNLIVTTDKGNFFVKVFGSFRDDEECKRYINVIEQALKAGVSHPRLYESIQGFLYHASFDGISDWLCVMQYIDGNNFYELQAHPTIEEVKFIVKQAALINSINLKPSFVYDHWAITNFLKEYGEKKQYLEKEDSELLEPLVPIFHSLSIDTLPHCFVHGDITKTNTMKSNDGRIYIIDFAVASWYPRIQELSVLLCDLFFDQNHPDNFVRTYDVVLSEYKKYISLTEDEVCKLPNYVKLAHAMHMLLANYEKVANSNTSAENEWFLQMGRAGLLLTNRIWK